MTDYTTPYYHSLTDKRHESGNFDFDFTPEELADSDRLMRDASNMEPVKWQCQEGLCMKVYAEETSVCDRCGGVVKGYPF
jgi:hypothetical protein